MRWMLYSTKQCAANWQPSLQLLLLTNLEFEIMTKVCSRAATHEDNPDSRWVSIRIADNGPSMSPQLQQQILESFSIGKRATARETTLAASYWIVTSRHGGDLKLRSPIRASEGELPTSSVGLEAPLGIGTEFEILLPLV